MPPTPTQPSTDDTAAHADFPCAQCGATLAFAPGTTSLKCPHCGHVNEINLADAPIEELDFHAALAASADSHTTQQSLTVQCKSCGARTTFPPNVTACRCAFCGVNIVGKPALTAQLQPRAILPFAINNKDAFARFQGWIDTLWFAPNDLKKFARSEDRFIGVYIPFWTYDATASTRYAGLRGEDYWASETYTTISNGRPVIRTRQVRRTRWYSAAGTVRDDFDDILVPATRSLPEKELHALEPWDLAKLAPFDERFLAGFRAESYQVNIEQGFDVARNAMHAQIIATIRQDIGGDRQAIHMQQTSYDKITYKHILLPVWVSAYVYRGHTFRFLVNARTGEVQGERPYSTWKVAFTALAVFAVVATAVVLFINTTYTG